MNDRLSYIILLGGHSSERMGVGHSLPGGKQHADPHSPVLVYGVGRVKKKVAPLPGSDSTQIRPPWRSTIFLQIASPMPVPEYSRRWGNGRKPPKIRSAW